MPDLRDLANQSPDQQLAMKAGSFLDESYQNFVQTPSTDYVPEVYDLVVSKIFPTNGLGIVIEWHSNDQIRVPRVLWSTGDRSSPLPHSLQKVPKDELLTCWQEHDTLIQTIERLRIDNENLHANVHSATALVDELQERYRRLRKQYKRRGRLLLELEKPKPSNDEPQLVNAQQSPEDIRTEAYQDGWYGALSVIRFKITSGDPFMEVVKFLLTELKNR